MMACGDGERRADGEIGGGWGRGRSMWATDERAQKGGGSAARYGRTVRHAVLDAYTTHLISSRDKLNYILMEANKQSLSYGVSQL
jgi:hypothetical protein